MFFFEHGMHEIHGWGMGTQMVVFEHGMHGIHG